MADFTIAADKTAAHRIQLEANTVTTVQIELNYPYYLDPIQVTAVTATKPVYARRGSTVTVGDPSSVIVPTSSWADIEVPPLATVTIALISEADATVSVARA